MKFPSEPFKIKVVEPICRLSRGERLVADIEYAPRILHSLDIGADDFGFGIADEILEKIQG